MTFGEDEIRSITEMVWSTTLGLDVRPCPGWLADQGDAATVAFVQIEGAWSGIVVLDCPTELAARVARRIYDSEYDPGTTAQIADAVGEIVNQTGGNLKGLLPEPCTLSLPTVVDSRARDLLPEGRLACRVAFECEGSTFVVAVIQRVAASEARAS